MDSEVRDRILDNFSEKLKLSGYSIQEDRELAGMGLKGYEKKEKQNGQEWMVTAPIG